MSKLQLAVHLINDEWFRKPFSKLEYTLRFPFFVKNAVFLFLTRILPTGSIGILFTYLVSRNVFLSFLLGMILTLGYELITLKDWYKKCVFPRYESSINLIKTNYRDVQNNNPSPQELVKRIELVTERSAQETIRIGYVGVAAWGWEIVLKLLYPLLVKDKTIPYYYLLIGLENKSIEADQKLWEIAQVNEPDKRNNLLKKYLEEYGSRAQDIDLAFPTLRENKTAISSLLQIYRNIPSPKEKVKAASERRRISYDKIIKNLRIPKKIFDAFVNKSQENVILREERRFYIFQGDYYIRQLLLKLADMVNINQNNLFNLSWGEIKDAVSKR